MRYTHFFLLSSYGDSILKWILKIMTIMGELNTFSIVFRYVFLGNFHLHIVQSCRSCLFCCLYTLARHFRELFFYPIVSDTYQVLVNMYFSLLHGKYTSAHARTHEHMLQKPGAGSSWERAGMGGFVSEPYVFPFQQNKFSFKLLIKGTLLN